MKETKKKNDFTAEKWKGKKKEKKKEKISSCFGYRILGLFGCWAREKDKHTDKDSQTSLFTKDLFSSLAPKLIIFLHFQYLSVCYYNYNPKFCISFCNFTYPIVEFDGASKFEWKLYDILTLVPLNFFFFQLLFSFKF